MPGMGSCSWPAVRVPDSPTPLPAPPRNIFATLRPQQFDMVRACCGWPCPEELLRLPRATLVPRLWAGGRASTRVILILAFLTLPFCAPLPAGLHPRPGVHCRPRVVCRLGRAAHCRCPPHTTSALAPFAALPGPQGHACPAGHKPARRARWYGWQQPPLCRPHVSSTCVQCAACRPFCAVQAGDFRGAGAQADRGQAGQVLWIPRQAVRPHL